MNFIFSGQFHAVVILSNDIVLLVVFCEEEVAQSIGIGAVLWSRTRQYMTGHASCPTDNRNAVTGSGTRRCGGIFGLPQWEHPEVTPCPLDEATAQTIAGLTETLLGNNVRILRSGRFR